MHRSQILTLLEEYLPETDQEQRHRLQILSFVRAQPQCFERSLQIGHLTASAWLLDRTQQKALLMHHAKLDAWMQLGGHCDGHPNMLENALREAREESGIQSIEPVMESIFDLDIHLIPAYGDVPEHLHYDLRFLLKVTSDEPFIKNHESKALLWVGPDEEELPTRSPSIVRMLRKWKGRLSGSKPVSVIGAEKALHGRPPSIEK